MFFFFFCHLDFSFSIFLVVAEKYTKNKNKPTEFRTGLPSRRDRTRPAGGITSSMGFCGFYKSSVQHHTLLSPIKNILKLKICYFFFFFLSLEQWSTYTNINKRKLFGFQGVDHSTRPESCQNMFTSGRIKYDA